MQVLHKLYQHRMMEDDLLLRPPTPTLLLARKSASCLPTARLPPPKACPMPPLLVEEIVKGKGEQVGGRLVAFLFAPHLHLAFRVTSSVAGCREVATENEKHPQSFLPLAAACTLMHATVVALPLSEHE